jgi:hypothetical protein
MSAVSRFIYRPVTIAGFLLLFIFLLWLIPPLGNIFPNAAALQAWLRDPFPPIAGATATKAETIFGVALFIAFCVASWNWLDAMMDWRWQRTRKPITEGDYLAARANFRRESYRMWRLASMNVLSFSLLLNWPLSTLYVTFGLLVFAYSEAVNSSLDRVYRLHAQELFRQERDKRRRALEAQREERQRRKVAEAEVVQLETEAGDGAV